MDKTLEEIVAEAVAINKYVRSQFINTEEHNDAALSWVQKWHKDFCDSYPVVVRYMCQMREFRSDVFAKWLKRLKQWNSHAEFLDAQAEYVVMLYRAANRRANAADINNVRTSIRAILQKEHEEVKKQIEAIARDIENERAQYAVARAEMLKEFVAKIGVDGIKQAETYRVIGPTEIDDRSQVETDPIPFTGLSANSILD